MTEYSLQRSRRASSIVGALLFLAVTLSAFGQNGISVDPPRIEQLVRAASRVHGALGVTNHGTIPLRVSVSMSDFDIGRDGQLQQFAPGTHSTSVSKLLRVSPLETVLAPGERGFFRYTIQAPSQYTQRRGFVYFTGRPIVGDTPNRQVLFSLTLGVPLYIENPRSPPGEVEVNSIEWIRDPKRPEEVLLRMLLTNKGERNFRPSGFVRAQSKGGSFAETWMLNPDKEVVLPGRSRVFEARFGPAPPEELKLETRLAISSRRTRDFRHSLTPPSPSAGD